jgi:MFS family permease
MPAEGTKLDEFRRGWPVVLTAACGSGLGVSGLFTYNSGLFVTDLQREIGLSRGTFGLAFFAATVAMAVSLPAIGRIVDRRGPQLPALLGSAALVVCFLSFGLLVRSIALYFALTVAVGLLTTGSSPLAYTRAVSAVFVRSRGLALGLTQVGIGISAALVPPLVLGTIATHGWQAGYYILAGMAAAGIVPALVGLGGRAAVRIPGGVGTGILLRDPLFRLQLAAFVTMALSFAGFLPHFVPMLRDAGVSIERAALFASLIGLSVIGSRLIIGWLADFVHAPYLAAAVCGLASLGCVALVLGAAALAPVGAIAFGCAMGAEADLVGFMTARHFGIASYGRAYALQYAAFMLAAGASPAWIGLLFDRTGSYQIPLIVTTVALLVAACLFLRMPRSAD